MVDEPRESKDQKRIIHRKERKAISCQIASQQMNRSLSPVLGDNVHVDLRTFFRVSDHSPASDSVIRGRKGSPSDLIASKGF